MCVSMPLYVLAFVHVHACIHIYVLVRTYVCVHTQFARTKFTAHFHGEANESKIAPTFSEWLTNF